MGDCGLEQSHLLFLLRGRVKEHLLGLVDELRHVLLFAVVLLHLHDLDVEEVELPALLVLFAVHYSGDFLERDALGQLFIEGEHDVFNLVLGQFQDGLQGEGVVEQVRIRLVLVVVLVDVEIGLLKEHRAEI